MEAGAGLKQQTGHRRCRGSLTWKHTDLTRLLLSDLQKQTRKSTDSVIAEKKPDVIEKDFQVKIQNHISTLLTSHKNL